jgi:hypothetical protein
MVKVKAKDGTVQSFRDGISPDAIRLAMLAYDDPETWGGLGKAVAKVAGQSAPPPTDNSPAVKEAGDHRSKALDILGKAWALPNTALGLAAAGPSYVAGKLLGTHPRFRFGDNALQLLNSPLNLGGRAYTLGNVQVYPEAQPPDLRQPSYTGAVGRVGAHEAGHSQQGQVLGPLYLPAEVLGSLLGDRNPLEVGADKYMTGRSWNGF